MSDKGSDRSAAKPSSSRSESSEKRSKPSSKKKAKVGDNQDKAVDIVQNVGREPSGNNVATLPEPSQAGDDLGQGPGEGAGVLGQAGQCASALGLGGHLGQGTLGFPQAVAGAQPFFPGQAYAPFAPQGFYPGFPPMMAQQMFGAMPQAPSVAGSDLEQDEEGWEEAQGADRQGCHEMSDSDTEELPVRDQVTERAKELDFASLKEGKLAELLKSRHKKVADADKVGPVVNETLAHVINSFFEETKTAGELERLAKDYPRVKNAEKMVVPKLEPELFSAVDQASRATDIALQNIQKGIVSALSAMAPVGSVMLDRGKADQELDELSGNLLDSFNMLALASQAVSSRRRENLKPLMQATYAKALAKPQEGSPLWLYGGNLSESTRKCEVARKLADKIVKRKGAQQNSNPGGGQQRQTQGQQQQNKRPRQWGPNWQNKKQGQNYAYGWGYQQPNFQPVQSQYHYQFSAPQQFQQQQRPRGQRPQAPSPAGQAAQDFQRRGPRK